jgi:hypothetical protein
MTPDINKEVKVMDKAEKKKKRKIWKRRLRYPQQIN